MTNKTVYILLAVFLGGLGIHKFYAGKMSGVFYLLFCWTYIPSIVGFFDALVAIGTPPIKFKEWVSS